MHGLKPRPPSELVVDVVAWCAWTEEEEDLSKEEFKERGGEGAGEGRRRRRGELKKRAEQPQKHW